MGAERSYMLRCDRIISQTLGAAELTKQLANRSRPIDARCCSPVSQDALTFSCFHRPPSA